MSKVKKLTSDFSGMIFYQIQKYRLKALNGLSTGFSRMWLRMKGVSLGKNADFFGVPHVFRMPASEIKMGNNLTFRSSFISNHVGLNRRCLISTEREGAQILIKDGAAFSGVVIAAAEYIEIGKNFLGGANSLITDFDWHYVDPSRRRETGSKASPVIIEDNVWLGLNTVVLKGVRIGKNSVIAANSVVVKDIPADVIAGGNPCKVIKPLTDESKSVSQSSDHWAKFQHQ